jgi:hypothetical protein
MDKKNIIYTMEPYSAIKKSETISSAISKMDGTSDHNL